MADMSTTRNFCIVAHIDHGKSTLADRMLLLAKAVTVRDFRDQMLDAMDLERERGITIKASAVTFRIEHEGTQYTLNLIDTPGHVDFHYEVSRSLAACEGALLLVDATSGVQAQTIANAYKAIDAGLAVIPAVNKIDMSAANPDTASEELAHLLSCDAADVLRVSAKAGTGVERVFDEIISRVPPPEGDPDAPLRALIFDSVFDSYRGAVVHIRVFDGALRAGDDIIMLGSGQKFQVTEVGRFVPGKLLSEERLQAGDVGYLMASIRDPSVVKVGDTVALSRRSDVRTVPGYKEPKPMVFCGLYPAGETNFNALRDALETLHLNDSSFVFQPESSQALGPGYRCGFLGLLHMEVIQQRLERESDITAVQTAPNVTYEIVKRDGETLMIHSAAELPVPYEIQEMREPVCSVSLITPSEYIGTCMKLAESKRGRYVSQEYLSPTRVILNYRIPLAEMLYDFYDKLKSGTRGYGTMDYEFIGFETSELVRVDFIVAQEKVDALATIFHEDVAETRARAIAKRLKKEIHRHMFEVVIQAAVNNRVVVRESIPALSKNVTGYLYGGDVTRKRKLWAKQKAGKKRMKQIGRVELSQEAFMAVLKIE